MARIELKKINRMRRKAGRSAGTGTTLALATAAFAGGAALVAWALGRRGERAARDMFPPSVAPESFPPSQAPAKVGDGAGAVDRALGLPSESAGAPAGGAGGTDADTRSATPGDTNLGTRPGATGTQAGGPLVGGAGRRTGATGAKDHGATGDISGGDRAPDLALGQDRPGPGDRAASPFRPDPTADLPEDKRDAAAPATLPNPAAR